ncbi:MAG TPA: PAS domain S-box protein, partial [Polyangiaceae bacterium]|nr:PAS domain S-box protein [Polyangiaceae bacterium]
MTDPDEDESTQSGAPTPPTGEVERLRAVERLLTSITLHAPDYILHFDRAGVISYMNRPPPGHRMQDVLGTNVRRWMEPAFHEAFGAALQRVYETAALASYESVGSVTGRDYVNRISPVLVDGVVESAVLITHDVTELKHAERERAEAEERYRTLVEASFQGLCISVAGEIIHANRAMEEMFGYGPGELVGVTAAQLATPESAAVVLRHIQEGVEAPYEGTAVRKDGSTFPCELLGRNVKYDGKPARITGMRDLTEMRREEAARARRESRVQHAQKLETLGVLAGGIAHDFNNLLTVVASNADLAMRELGDSQQVKASLEQISAAVQRGSGLTHQLLVYAGQVDPRTETVDL